MTVLPIVQRELWVRARKPATYSSRVAAALLAMVIAGATLPFLGSAPPGQAGGILFTSLSWMALIYCLFEGVRNTADCLSEEKRQGTLGLLFLTDLKGHDVVFGKMAACSLYSFYGLVAILPVLGLSLLLGGVTAGQFWRMALALVNALFFAVSCGLLVSSVSLRPGKAWGGALGTLALFGLGLPLTMDLLARLLGWATGNSGAGLLVLPRQLIELLATATPLATFRAALSTSPGGSTGFWRSWLAGQAIAWLLLAWASRRLPRSWQDQPAAAQPTSGKRHRPAAAHGGRVTRYRQLLDRHPVAWLVLRGREPSGWIIWVVAGAGALTDVAICFLTDVGQEALSMVLLSPFKLILKLFIPMCACRLFAEAREAGTLETILACPLPPGEIIKGQLHALRRMFLGPVLLLAGGDLVCCVWPLILAWVGFADPASDEYPLLGFLFWKQASFLTNALALCYGGMWLALRLRRPNQAVGLTLLLFLILPSLVCGLGLIVDLVVIFMARSKLRDLLRVPSAPLPVASGSGG